MEKQGFKNGSVKISNEILSVIALAATNEVDGVRRVVGELIPQGEEMTSRVNHRGVRVDFEHDRMKIYLSVIVEPDVKIMSVCREVQETVKNKIQVMTGLDVSEVNVRVEGLNFKN